MHRFFVPAPNIKANLAIIDGQQARHIEKVLRLKPGDVVILFDGTGYEYIAQLCDRQKGEDLVAQIMSCNYADNEPLTRINLVQGIAKGDKMDTIIQKATEIGIAKVYPLLSNNTVVQLDYNRMHKKVKRWEQVACEACKQCRRNIILQVNLPITFAEMLEVVEPERTILLYENEKNQGLKRVLRENIDRLKNNEIFLLVGPEGGFTEQEIAQARQKGMLITSLGKRILRTETAGLVAAGAVLYEYGDLGE